MKQIRFRVWEPHFKRFLYPDMENPESGEVIDSNTNEKAYYHCARPYSDCVRMGMTLGGTIYENTCDRVYVRKEPEVYLQQFTGLNDKTGKEIYEGDVILYECSYQEAMEGSSNDIDFVVWENGAFRLKNGDYLHELAGDNQELMYEKVIGNIFENPEMIIK